MAAFNVTDSVFRRSLQPNGLRVLSKIPGLLENLERAKLERTAFYSVLPEDKGLLTEQPTDPAFSFYGVRRPVFHKALIEAAERLGVEFKWGHKLVSLEQAADSVTATFENGSTATGSFVVGCDGLHSNTRKCLFGDQKADFTGLCQVSMRDAKSAVQHALILDALDRRDLSDSREHEKPLHLPQSVWRWRPYCCVCNQC